MLKQAVKILCSLAIIVCIAFVLCPIVSLSEPASSILFSIENQEVQAGETVTIDYTVVDKGISLNGVNIIADYGYTINTIPFDYENRLKGTCSFSPVSDGSCWLEITYTGSNGKLNKETSEKTVTMQKSNQTRCLTSNTTGVFSNTNVMPSERLTESTCSASLSVR